MSVLNDLANAGKAVGRAVWTNPEKQAAQWEDNAGKFLSGLYHAIPAPVRPGVGAAPGFVVGGHPTGGSSNPTDPVSAAMHAAATDPAVARFMQAQIDAHDQQGAQTRAGYLSPTDLLSALLAHSQGQIPQGYANLFTQVIGPMQAQMQTALGNQLAGAMGVAPNIPGMSPADRAAVDKAMGSTLGDLNAMNSAAFQSSGLGAQALQQLFTNNANTDKLMTSLVNSLSYLPFATQTAGTVNPYAQSLLAALGITLPGSTVAGIPATSATGQAPVIP